MNCKVITSKTIKWCCLSALAVLAGTVATVHASEQNLSSNLDNVSTEQQSQVQSNTLSTVVVPTAASHASATDTNSNVKNGWIKNDNGEWTYYSNGQVTAGRNYVALPTINGTGTSWYLMDNGVAQSRVQQWAGTYYYFDPKTYTRVDNNYVQSQWGDWYMFGPDGRIVTRVYKWAGTYYYFDPSTYLRVDNDYRQSQWGYWYMFGPDGRIVTGIYNWMGSYYYFDPTTYLKMTHDFWAGKTYYQVQANGIVTGVLLNAPYINQYEVGDMACEATSMLEALHCKGYALNYNIQNFIKTMPIAKNGNPNDGFGGGYQTVTPGTFQSIYPAPLANWASNFGHVQNISGSTPAQIRQELVNGNPVVVYVTMHWAAPVYGHYWWGTGVNNSHVMTVDGYCPGQYHVEDPAGGSYWVSASNFENAYNIKRFAVVVR